MKIKIKNLNIDDFVFKNSYTVSLSSIIAINSKCKYCGGSIFEGILYNGDVKRILYNVPNNLVDWNNKPLMFKNICYNKEWRNISIICKCGNTKWVFADNDKKILKFFFNLKTCIIG